MEYIYPQEFFNYLLEFVIFSIIETLASPEYVVFIFFGSILGVVFGALPGLTAPMAIAVMLPLTYSMSSHTGFGFLLGLHAGVGYGGAIPAILLNIPGTPSAVMTAVDGNAMAKRGLAGKAIGISTVASFVAGIFSVICLIVSAPYLAKFALKFGPHEYFAAGVFGLSITSGLVGKDWIKGLWSAAFGILISTVGLDPLTSNQRFSYDSVGLMSGIPFIPVMIGMYGLTRVLTYLEGERDILQGHNQKLIGLIPTWRDLRRIAKSTLQGSITGTLIGALPGAGPAIAAFLSYDIERKTSSKLDEDGLAFGEGRIDGVAAPEAANNSVTGGALIPLLTFGIPGSASAAIMLGAFMMYNLTPGPLFFVNHSDVVYSIYFSMILANIFILIVCLLGIKVFIKILQIPISYLMPGILVLCIIGSYSIQNNSFHIIIMAIFGFLGYCFEKSSIPQMPLVLGMILGPLIEKNLRQVLILEDGNFWTVFMRPISGGILLLSLLIFILPIIIKNMGHQVKR